MKISWREVSGYLLIVVASCFWGGSASLGKSLFQAGMSTAQLMQVRSVMSAVVITVILALFRRKHFRIQPRDLWGLLLLAIPGLVVVNASYYQAVKMLPVAIAVFIQFCAPVLIFLYGWITKREQSSAAKLSALCLSIFGTFLMVQIQKQGLNQLPAFGLFCAFLAMVSYAFYLLVSHRLAEKHSAFTLVLYGYSLAGLFWLFVVNPVTTANFMTSNQLWIRSLLFAVFSTVIPFTLFLTGLARVSPTGASIASGTETITASLFAFFFLGETLAVSQIFGGVLILAAIILLILAHSQTPQEAQDIPN
jgi:drug/metabolite transporter (DMT)-like permease